VIQRQLGHSNLGITSIYLQGIDNAEIIDAVHARRGPMIPVNARCGSDRHPSPAPRFAQSKRDASQDWPAIRPRRGDPAPAAPLRFGGHLPETAAGGRQSSA
jgi:hypothetical protein